MAAHWFRIPYAKNAFLRSLAERRVDLDTLSLADGVAAMLAFQGEYRPQHAALDSLECSWGPATEVFEFSLTRRMKRLHQVEAPLSLVFSFALTPARAIDGSIGVAAARGVRSVAGYRAVARAAILTRRLR